MENYVILDDQLSDSSHSFIKISGRRNRSLATDATRGRLNNRYVGFWSPDLNKQNEDQWLQVFFSNHPAIVKRIATQGSYMYEEWVTSYKLQYGDDGKIFQYYKEKGQNTDKVNNT